MTADLLLDDQSIDRAAAAIAPHVVATPLVRSAGLSRSIGAEIHLKCELFQPTGSFKVRGVTTKALQLTEAERAAGLLAFSAGNHAMAVAHVGTGLGLPVTVCMPAGAVRFKVDAVRAMGATLDLVDGDLVAHSMAKLDELGATLVHPFDDPAVVAGTATIGREIVAEWPEVDTIVVPVGGGGLISGLAMGAKRAKPGVRVVGVEPDSADVVQRSREAGGPVALDHPRSLADGLAAPVTGEINLAHIDAYVDELVRVPEADIGPAWRDFVDLSKLAVEPAVAVCLAAIRSGSITIEPGERVCLIASGGNADFGLLGGV